MRLKQLTTIRYADDCQRIQAIALERHGLEISLAEAQELWDDYSDKFCAGWLFLPDSDNELSDIIAGYIDRDAE
jgi:hypothetical protein